MPDKAQITALITLSDAVAEPKSAGVHSGFEAHHKFPEIDFLAGGFHSYGDDALHYPGEELVARIAFPSWAYFGSTLQVGDAFEIYEHQRPIGRGVVQAIHAPD
nr:hypothetical protein [uncultured Devosia sp.]